MTRICSESLLQSRIYLKPKYRLKGRYHGTKLILFFVYMYFGPNIGQGDEFAMKV